MGGREGGRDSRFRPGERSPRGRFSGAPRRVAAGDRAPERAGAVSESEAGLAGLAAPESGARAGHCAGLWAAARWPPPAPRQTAAEGSAAADRWSKTG